MSDGELPYPKWQGPCVDAVREFDRSRLPERSTAAETAIHARLQERETSPDGDHERSAIADAMKTLRKMKRDRLELA
jgi:predicted RNase H-like nuclease (RuvC/YqgF family)